MSKGKVIILGAGLVGSLMAINLRKAGFSVTIFEKRTDPRKQPNFGGRSINLALSVRGLLALEAVGLKEEVKSIAIPMHGRMMHSTDGALTSQAYGKEGQFINAISRGLLNKMLVDKAEEMGAEVHFDHKCVKVDVDQNEVIIEANGAKNTFTADLILGTDGAFSAMRQSFQRRDRFDFSQNFIEHGYKELTIAPKNGDFALDNNALHIWPRGNFMMIALPNKDKSFTCTLFFPFEGPCSFESIKDDDEIAEFFLSYFPDLVAVMPDYKEQYKANPVASLITIKCFPWAVNRCMMLGDASHAIVPFYGQGMNAGFEDCFLFAEMSKAMNYDWTKILPQYQEMRKIDADAISDLALQNFIEMRDSVADPKFLFQKKVEAKLHELYPNDWIPQYTMVTFSNLPYSKALKKGKLQHKIIQKHLTYENMQNFESMKFENIISELLSEQNSINNA
jgi:kynurenine 3-monooxygenase